ncbi:MAG TPA: DUF86 domain-containing protein [Candidatus Paceibacterota bacterium]
MTEPIPIEKEKVSERIADIKHALAKLNSYQDFSAEDLANEEDKFSLVAYWLRIALEGVLTIGTHILSRLPSNGKKKDYTRVLVSLGDYGVIPQEFAKKIRGMAGYRNRLVHLYWEVTPEELAKTLQDDIVDFEEFIEHIEKFLQKQEGK